MDPIAAAAIYTGDELKAYRRWLTADSYEATNTLAEALSQPTSRTTTSTPGNWATAAS